jgi:hypothetical protein
MTSPHKSLAIIEGRGRAGRSLAALLSVICITPPTSPQSSTDSAELRDDVQAGQAFELVVDTIDDSDDNTSTGGGFVLVRFVEAESQSNQSEGAGFSLKGTIVPQGRCADDDPEASLKDWLSAWRSGADPLDDDEVNAADFLRFLEIAADAVHDSQIDLDDDGMCTGDDVLFFIKAWK